MLDPLTVAWVRDVLGEGPQVFALILTVHAASGIVGSLLVGRFGRRFTPRDLIGWGSVVAGAALALRYNIPALALALAMSAVAGITSVASSIGVETLAMQSVPRRAPRPGLRLAQRDPRPAQPRRRDGRRPCRRDRRDRPDAQRRDRANRTRRSPRTPCARPLTNSTIAPTSRTSGQLGQESAESELGVAHARRRARLAETSRSR